MYEFEKWIRANKKLCICTGIFGLMLSPFLWPFFLAILFQSLSLAVPIVLAWLLITMLKKEKENTYEAIRKDISNGTNETAGQVSPDGMETDGVSADGKEEGQKSVKPKPQQGMKEQSDEKSIRAVAWYQNGGRERLFQIRDKLKREGKTEFSISKDGICSARKETGFQRVGMLPNYQGISIMAAKEELEKDGFFVRAGKNFVWISWKRRNGCAL